MNWDPKSAPKLDFNEDFYSVLEMDPAIDKKDLKKAYYKIVFKYHPDNKEGEAAKALANKQMMVINNAYKVLKEPDQRAAYDRKRRMGQMGQAANKSGTNNPPPSASSSASSSSASYRATSSSGGFGGFDESFFNYQRQAQEPVESLTDIFGELFGEIRRGGAAGLLEDLVDFLEDQVVPGGGVVGGAGGASSREEDFIDRASGQSRQELDAEITTLQAALANLSSHLEDLKRLRVEAEAEALKPKKPLAPDAPRTVQDIEERLKKIEAIRGLSARIDEVGRQTRQLQRQIKTCCDIRTRKSQRQGQGGGESQWQGQGGSVSQGQSYQNSQDPKSRVDQELMQLKRKMGIK